MKPKGFKPKENTVIINNTIYIDYFDNKKQVNEANKNNIEIINTIINAITMITGVIGLILIMSAT